MGFETLGKKLAQLGADTKTGVQKMNENYQLSSKLNEEKKSLEQLFAQIGAAVVEKYADSPLEGLEEQIAQVAQIRASIEELEAQVQKVKGIAVCPDCGKVAEKGETVCSSCGAQLPEVEDLGEKFKQDAKEAGSEVGELVNGAAEKAKVLLVGFADKADAFVKSVKAKASAAEESAEETAEETAEAACECEEAAEETAEACECEGAAEEACECEEAAEETAEACECDEAAEETVEETCECEETAEGTAETEEA